MAGSNPNPTTGNVASGAADDASPPVKVGGRYNATQPTLTDGQRGDTQLDSKGNLKVSIWNTSGLSTGLLNGLGDANPGNGAGVVSFVYSELYNGATWDRARGSYDTAALITAVAATATQTGADQTNYNSRGVVVVLDATAVNAVGSFTLSIQGKDAASGKYFTLLTGAAVSTVSTNVYTLYPGVTVAANAAVSNVLPRIWRVVATYNSGTNLTFTVGASLIP